MEKRLIILAMAAGAMLGAYGKTFSLDLRAPAKGGAKPRLMASAQPHDDGTLRSFNLDAGVADVGEVAVGDELTFTLFDDVALALTLKEKMPSPLGGDAFLAEVAGYEGIKTAIVLRTVDGLTIDVQDFRNGKYYKVLSTSDGVRVLEVEAKAGTCGCDAHAPFISGSASTSASMTSENSSSASVPSRSPARRLASAGASDTCVDILVAYDKNAVTWAQSNGGGLTNFAQTAVQKMNSALANTGLDEKFRFRLVGVTSVAASSDDLDFALNAATEGTSGWEAIKEKRDEVGADIVTVLIDTGSAYGTTGLGWSLQTTDFARFSDSAYNVCAVRSVAVSHTMTHEVGHNMGCGHSDQMADKSNCGPQLYDYSAGYYLAEWFPEEEGSEWFSEKRLHTIMAYDDDGYGNHYKEIPYFSSSEKQYTCNGESVVVGDEKHDNTRTLENTYAAVAAWREQKVPMTYDVVFEPASGTIFEDSITVTLTSPCADAEIRYTLDGSEPHADSVHYNGAITLADSATIRAVAVVDGVCGFPFEAKYTKSSLASAIGGGGLKWRFSNNLSWAVYDLPDAETYALSGHPSPDGLGIRAVRHGPDDAKAAWLETDITGPCDISFFNLGAGGITINVLVDGKLPDASDLQSQSSYFTYWQCHWDAPTVVKVPSGPHVVRLEVEFWADDSDSWEWDYAENGEQYVILDGFTVHRIPAPGLFPATAEKRGDHDVATFEKEQMVSISSASDTALIFYTLDGNDPGGEKGILYDGPLFIDKTTTVKAIAMEPGHETPSVVTTGFYLERTPPKPGEWTGNAEGAFAGAAKDGKMVAVLCMNYNGCPWSWALEPVLRKASFLAWAKANGVYLVNTDSGWLDGEAAPASYFWNLYRESELAAELNGSVYYPTFCFASPTGKNTCLGTMLARNDGEHSVNGIAYEDTPESLIACFASVMGKSPLGAPAATVTGNQVTLVNTNGTGTLYYTLDGSAPTREHGRIYDGTVDVPSGAILQAVVWPEGTGGVSGIPFVYANERLETEMPEAPLVQARDGSGRYGALIKWNAVRGAVRYLVYRASVNAPHAAVKIGETSQCRYWDADSRDGTKYWYWVKTVNNAGESDFSEGVQAGVGRVTVSFDSNGGQGTMSVLEVMPDVAQALPANRFEYADHVFDGWAERADGEVVFADGQVVSFTAGTTLYAKWRLRQVSGNDASSTAYGVNGERGQVYGTNRDATADAGEFLKQEYGSEHTVWFKWTAPSSGQLRLEVTDADFDTVMGAFVGSSATSLREVAYDDDGGEENMSAVSLGVESGTTYFIAVGGYGDAQGDFVLNWQFVDESVLPLVSFEPNGGTVDTASLRCMPGMAIGSLPWPEWQGHRFDGWFTEADGGEQVDEYWIVPEDGATLYAHWTERLAWHTDSASALAEAKSTGKLIFFLSGRETCMNTIGTRDYTCEEPEVREALGDYVLWFCNCDTQGQDLWRYVGSSGSISLPFVCVINPYTNVPLVRSQGYLDADDVFSLLEAAGPAPGLNTVLFDANGGEVDEAERKVPSNFAVGELPTPTRLKYKFLGWFTEPEGGTKISASTKVNGNVTYYAHWEYDGSAPVNVSVASGCEGMGSVTGGNATFKVGAKVQLKATANRNHVFVGWYEDGRKIAEAASFTYVATGEEEVSLFAYFVTAADDIASLKVNVDDVTAAADGAVSFDLAGCLSSLTPAKLSVSGLPSGVKYDAKTGLVSGRSKKPGVYVVKVTATNVSATGKNAVVQAFNLKVPNFTTDMFRAAGLDTDGQYVLDAGALPDAFADVVDAVTSGGWTLKIDGLPAGVKFDAKKGAFSGVATKEGFYTVTFTATKGSGKTAEKEIATATFEVAFPTLTIGIAACRNETATNACKVVGGGRYAVGAKVALKATPGKGNVFAGWFDAGGNPLAGAADYRTASFPYAATGADVTLTAKFATVAEDMEGLKVTVSDDTTEPDGTYELDLGGCVESLSMPKLAVKGLPTGLKFDAKTGLVKGRATKPGVYTVKVEATNTSVKKATSASAGEFRLTVPNFTSDVLPNLKPETDAYGVVRCGVIFDPSIVDCSPEDGWTVKAAGLPAGLKWDAKQNAITGVPTAKAGYYTVTFTATKGKEKEVATITLNVEPLPAWAVGTFDGAVDGGGVVQALTVGANGKISGKVLEGGNSWGLSAASIGSYDEDSGAYLATVIGKAGKEIVTNMVAVTEGSDGSGIASSDGWTAYQNLWKRADTKASQPVFKKNIDVELDNGIKVTFKKDGVVAFAGNVDGSKVSGSSQLVWNGEGWNVTLYAPPAKTFVGFCETYVVTFSLDGAMTPSVVPME